VLTIVERGSRGAAPGALAAAVTQRARKVPGAAPEGELVVLAPGAETADGRRVASAILRELESGLSGFNVSVSLSRVATDPADLYRAGAEALLAANVAVAQGEQLLAFEETGAYRLLLPAMSEDPAELERFHQETVAPIVSYDEQYETELVRTLESFLEADGNVARTSEKLFTHRHTIRYRLERVRELTGLDVSSTDGRERLGLGLKSMRVLGIPLPQGPAAEAGSAGGRVKRGEKDR
jgi:DNA-binding PucR family transcriptional regulator